MKKIEENFFTESNLSQMNQEEMVNIFKILMNDVINESTVIKNEVEKFILSKSFNSINDKVIKSRINKLTVEIGIYLRILQNIDLTINTLHFASEFTNEVNQCAQEVNGLLKEISETKESSQSYFVDVNGDLLSRVP